jgi:UDP-N-acetylglucosamine 2-epimerase (non-hydrolysing)
VFTGNPILDALQEHLPRPVAPEDRSGILVTLHRQETVDNPERLRPILAALAILAREQRVVWPVHPRARVRMEENGLQMPLGVEPLPPLGHVEFLARLAGCAVAITDSGGVQEEAAILGTPCVTVRRHTERPETIAAGVGVLAGVDVEGLLAATGEVLAHWRRYARPVPELYGDGHAGERIAVRCAQWLGYPAVAVEATAAPGMSRSIP